MWQSDEDFLKDLDQMDEICTTVIVNDQTRSEFQEKQTGNNTRSKRVKIGRLYSFSDEEEERPSKNYSLENFDPDDQLRNLAEVRNQIRMATGNVYNNDVITEYWQKSSENHAPKIETQTISDRGHSLVFKPKYQFQQPLVSANSSPRKANPKKGKKESVAATLANNLQILKAKSENRIDSEIKTVPQSKVEAFEPQPKVEPCVPRKAETKTRCRISLPIACNNYKDYYSGAKITPPILREQTTEEPVLITNTWDQYSEQSFDQVSIVSSLSSNNTSASDYSINSQQNNVLDLSSKTEFPPL